MAENKRQISAEERSRYVDFINQSLSGDADLPLPIDPSGSEIFEVVAESVLFCKMIHKWFPEVLDVKEINLKKSKNSFEKNLNHDVAIAAAQKIGCSVVNIGGADLSNKNETLVLGLMWQLIKTGPLKAGARS